MRLGAELQASSVMGALGATERGGPGKLPGLRGSFVKDLLVFERKKHVVFKKVPLLLRIPLLCKVVGFNPSLKVLAIQATP